MIIPANPLLYRTSQPVADDESVTTLRSFTYRPRATVVSLLGQAFEDCGCWTRERSSTATSLQLRFEMPLHAAAELYSSLIACGLEFDRRGHGELALLCTLRRHAIVPDALRRILPVRLELTFADELEGESPAMTGVSATPA